MRLDPPSREAPQPKRREERINEPAFREGDYSPAQQIQGRVDQRPDQRVVDERSYPRYADERRKNPEAIDEETRARRERRAKEKERLERERRYRAVPLAGASNVRRMNKDDSPADENDRFDLFIHDRHAPGRPAGAINAAAAAPAPSQIPAQSAALSKRGNPPLDRARARARALRI